MVYSDKRDEKSGAVAGANSDRHFSVLMSVYEREKPAFLEQALASLCEATERPAEVVLVEDGPIGEELRSIVEKYRSILPLRSLKLGANQGLAAALRAGLEVCNHALVARFDTDDISLPSRFQEQIDFLIQHPHVAAVSCWVEEFDDESASVHWVRALPDDPHELSKFSKFRSPLNHPAAMFRMSAVQRVGGYQDEILFEDYSLWLRLLHAGYQLANVPKVLVRMRAGREQTRRRMGARYAKLEFQFATKFYRLGYFSLFEYLRFIGLRIPTRFLTLSLLRRIYLLVGRQSSVVHVAPKGVE